MNNYTIRLPEKLNTLVEQRAAKLGMKKSEYIRYLIVKDLQRPKKEE